MSDLPRWTAAMNRVSDRIRHAISGVTGIWLGCGFVLVLVWGGLLDIVVRESRHLASDEDTRVRVEAKAFSEYVALHLLLVDRMIINIRHDYQATGEFPATAELVPELGADARFLIETAIADQTGRFVAATMRPFKGKSISDRPYFRALAADPRDRLYVSQTAAPGRLSGKAGLKVARPVLSAKGEFRGVVTANIDPLMLRRYFDGSDIFEHGGIAVIMGRDDGIIRLRFTKYSFTSGGRPALNAAAMPDVNVPGGTREITSSFDGLQRLLGFHQVGAYPLRAGVAIRRQATWSLDNGSLLFALAMTATFSLALILLTRTRARMEVEQQESIRLLAASRQKELEANRMKSQFLATVSHELRTPLNSILGFSELIRDEGSGPETSKFAGLIHNSGKHLHTLVNTLLDLAKIEAGKMEVDREAVDLSELLLTVTDTHRISAENKGLALSLTMSPPGPTIVNTDRTKLLQVLNNVLHNAIKFTDSGQIAVTGFSVRDGVLIRVVDSGRGIAEKDMARVFQRFNTVAHEPDQQKGSGLGLALSRSLMELLGGAITLQSQSGTGTQVTIFLPKGAQDEH